MWLYYSKSILSPYSFELGVKNGEEKTSMNLYIDALYYSIITCTTVSYGDITP